MEDKIFIITENGFCMDGSGMVAIPHCKVTAQTFWDAKNKLDLFLSDKKLRGDIELITPFDKIKFD
jgi:hypothetical protein